MQLQINTSKRRDGIQVVYCEGRIIYGPEVDAFTRVCEAVFFAGNELVVDLSRVRSLDNHGVAALLVLLESSRATGRDLRLVLHEGKPAQLLQLMGLNDQFKTYASMDEAVAGFRSYAVA
jgi:anti-anti-sigma factor